MKENMINYLTVKDIPFICKCLQNERFDCCDFNDYWTPQELEKWLNNIDNICIGMYNEKELIGFCLTYFAKDINKVYLENIFVIPGSRRQGVAKALIHYIIKAYSSLDANNTIRFVALVDDDNTPAIRSLSTCGFSIGNSMRWIQKNAGVDY